MHVFNNKDKLYDFLINNNCPIKWSFALDVTFTKTAVDGEVHVKNATFSCKRHAFNNNDNDDVKKMWKSWLLMLLR